MKEQGRDNLADFFTELKKNENDKYATRVDAKVAQLESVIKNASSHAVKQGRNDTIITLGDFGADGEPGVYPWHDRMPIEEEIVYRRAIDKITNSPHEGYSLEKKSRNRRWKNEYYREDKIEEVYWEVKW